ncbi:MAG: septal ring lytic transglycosylase RlpA family protein [Cyanothece sp. SIO1E1]|nr:septal ring lytic transglycosylase RlpA family protein [Cyanothece sp. SIO1E1]
MKNKAAKSRAIQSKIAAKSEVFQVWVKDKLILELTSQYRAALIAQRLNNLLLRPDFDLSTLRPANVNGIPVGKVKDEILFVVDEKLAAALNRSSDLLAAEWINNLRVALNGEPLTLAEAQTNLYGLSETGARLVGTASWYGPRFHGRPTATGEVYNQNELTAAHPSLPFNTYLKVTNLKSKDSIIVRVNDRGPYVGKRSLDLSRAAAQCLNSEQAGVVPYEAVIMVKHPLKSAKSPEPL